MFRWSWALLVLLSVNWASADSFHQGTVVEIDSFGYTYWLGDNPEWSMECRYRVDGSEWQHHRVGGVGDGRRIRIPGTSVEASVVDGQLCWEHTGDVRQVIINL